MQTPFTIRLDDLSLWFIERGPIREMIEVEFETALFRLEREQSRSISAAAVRELHDQIVEQLFFHVIRRAHCVRREGESFVLSPAGQKELQEEAYRRLAKSFPRQMCDVCNAAPMQLRWDILLHPPLVLSLVRKYLTQRPPSS
jgi:hypothetical protein